MTGFKFLSYMINNPVVNQFCLCREVNAYLEQFPIVGGEGQGIDQMTGSRR